MDPSQPSFWTVLYVLSGWIIRVVMLIVVPFRRSPDAAKAWLLLIFVFPWAGLLLYWFIGRPTYPRWRYRKVARLPELFAPIRKRLQGDPHFQQPELPP